MPKFTPGLKDGKGLQEFIEFIATKTTADPWAIVGDQATSTLQTKLKVCLEDVEDSVLEADEVEVNDREAAALIYYGTLFADSKSGSSVKVVGNICQQISSRELLKKIAQREVSPNKMVLTPRIATRVFVIHGRDRQALLEVRHWLKDDWGLEVSVMEAERAEGSKVLAEALEERMTGCGTSIVIATADDLGRLRSGAKELPRTRQNVLLELGWMIGLLGRERVIVLLQEEVVEDFPSDFAGVTTIRFKGDVREAFDDLRKKLKAIGVLSSK